MKKIIDINADVGEGYGIYRFGSDQELMKSITSANIACGFHAGDYQLMDQTILLAKQHDVKVGAHPGYPDRYGFGRKEMNYSLDEIRNQLLYQIGAIKSLASYRGMKLNHIKPHGALYNKASKDEKTAKLIAEIVGFLGGGIALIGLSGSEMDHAAKMSGIPFLSEVFVDRRYTDDGLLVARSQSNSSIESIEASLEQVKTILDKGMVRSINNKEVRLKADTICVHGDTEKSSALARQIYLLLHGSSDKDGI